MLPLGDGMPIGHGFVTTVVTGHVGPIAIGAYVVELAEGGVALIDAGIAADAARIRGALARKGNAPTEVRAIFFTHGHNDHVAGALAFPAAWCRVFSLSVTAPPACDGTLAPNTMLSDDAEDTVQSLLALADRLGPRRGEIRQIAFGHQGPVDGLDPLLKWASAERSR